MSAYPAISLWQPHASLLFVKGAKVHETRHWRVPERYLGQTVLIHAAKKPINLAHLTDALFELCIDLIGEGFRVKLPHGAFVGAAVLKSCAPVDDHRRRGVVPDTDADYECGNWVPGRYAWRLENRRPLLTPQPAIGRQAFWYPEWPDPPDLSPLLGDAVDA